MALKSTPHRYGTVAVAIHWLAALLIVGLWFSGTASQSMTGPDKIGILSVHVPIGITVVALTVLRLLWWWLADTRPGAIAGTPALQHRAAQAVHVLFYVAVIVMGLSGIAMVALSGAMPVLFGGEGALPDFETYGPSRMHALGATAIQILFVIHVAAALYHHFMLRDATLSRMLGRG